MQFQYLIVAISSCLSVVTCDESHKSLFTNTASIKSQQGSTDRAKILFFSNPEILIEDTREPSLLNQNSEACSGKGEYLNACGECIGRNSEKDEDYGMDSCGVCYGLDRCLNPDCYEDFEGESEIFVDTRNCSGGALRFSPTVLDMAESARALISLTGSSLTRDDTECGLLNDPRRIDVNEIPFGLELSFDFNGKEEKIKMRCNTTEGRHLRATFNVVNSKLLLPLSSDKFSIPYGEKNKLILKVSNLFALVDLMCFAILNGTVIYKYWTKDIQGNSLMSQITCDELWLESINNFQIGVAYSSTALALAKTMVISVHVDPLLILEALRGSDDVIMIHFNQNIDETEGCEKILKGPSLNRFSKCETTANQIKLTCKTDTCRENQIIELVVRADSSKVRKSFALKLPASESTKMRKLIIEGPRVACAGNVITFSINGDEAAKVVRGRTVQWSLSTSGGHSVNGIAENVEGTKGGKITAGNQQRRNLILWHGLRELRRVQKASETGGENSNDLEQPENTVFLNSSLLQPDISYQLTASFNTSTKKVTLIKSFIVLGINSTPVIEIHGPKQVAYNQKAFYEAEVTLCKPLGDLTYTWKKGNNETVKMVKGKKSFISGSQLAKGLNQVTVHLTLNETDIAQASFETKVKKGKLRHVLLEELVVGTGQSFALENLYDEAAILPSNVTYKWTCFSETVRCTPLEKSQNALEIGGDYEESTLNIAKGSLVVGRYKFTLLSKLPTGDTSWSSVQVNVVPGEPPLFKLASYTLEPDLNVIVSVLDVFSSCEVETKCLKRTNFTFYDIRKSTPSMILTGTPSHPESTRIKINIPANQIKHGSSYTFQVFAICGNGIQSWITFSVPVPEKSANCQLRVSPKSGIALKTKFKFILQNCSLRDSVISYGYRINGSDTFLTTSVRQNVELYGFPGKIRSLAKVCESDKSCSLSLGDHLSVDFQSVENNDLKEAIMWYKNNLNSLLYEEAAGVVQLMIHSLGNQPNNSFIEVIQILKERIEYTTELLMTNTSINDLALDLLQFATNISKSTGYTDDILPQIVMFRDKIQQKISEKSASLKIKREPLILTGSQQSFGKDPRPRRSPISADEETRLSPTTIKTMLTTFAYVILNHKDPEKVREEKEKFLNSIPGYILDMCNGIGRGDGVLAGSSIAQLSVVKAKQSKIRQEINVPLCSTKCSNATGQIFLGRQDIKNNDGVCVGSSYMPYDFYSDTKINNLESHLIRQSGVYSTKIFNFVGNEVNDEVELKKPLAVFRLPLWKETNFNDESSKCFAWMEGQGWSRDMCRTMKPVLSNGVHLIECRCPVPGIFGIFSSVASENEVFVNKTSVEDKERLSKTSSNPETNREHPKVTATFTINENFNETVGNKQEEFEENIKNQLIDKVSLPEQAKVETDNYQDNIKVLIKLKYWDQNNLPTIILDLADILDKGELKLLSLDRKELKIPRQKLELTLVNRKRPSSLTATLSSIIFLGLTIVVVMIFASVLVKWRRRQRALNFLQVAASSDPKYLKLHDSASIERIIRQSSGERFHSNEAGDRIMLSVYQQRNHSAI